MKSERKEKSTTIKDIARLAGTGTTTVSKYFSGKGYLGAEMRARIEKAVLKTNYRRNQSASNLKSGTSHQIAVVLPSTSPTRDLLSSYFMSRKFAMIAEEAFKNNYDLLLLHVPADDPSGFERIIRTHSFAGVIFLIKIPDNFQSDLTKFRIPYVLSNLNSKLADPCDLMDSGTNGVVSDYPGIIRDAVSYAAQKGYGSIGFESFGWRVEHAEKIINEACKKFKIRNVTSKLEKTLETGGKLWDLAAGERSLLVAAEQRHVISLHALLKKNSKFGLLAMDDLPEYSILSPQISAITQDIDAISMRSVQLLDEMIKKKMTVSKTILIPAKIIPRETT